MTNPHPNAEKAVITGGMAPDFTLLDTSNVPHTLSEVVAEQPLILVFYRGDWCPWCQIQMKQLAGIYDQLQERGVALWAVSPQSQEKNIGFREKREIPFPILEDVDLDVIHAYGLEDELDPHTEHIPYPTTYIIERGGEVFWHRLGRRKDDRPSPGEILAALPK